MASSDENLKLAAVAGGEGPTPPGKPMILGQKVIDKGAEMLQSLKPVKQFKQHICSFALYGHDLTRQIETHHYCARLNQDFLQCAVYNTDDSSAHLIGVEYIVSDSIFNKLPPEEQKLWHSHAHEIKSGLLASPRVPEMLQKKELDDLSKTYGKFWCTWQVDRGDRLPLGAPALMMSPQGVNLGMVHPDLVKKRDDKYRFSSEELKESRLGVEVPESTNPNADYWMKHGTGFAIDVVETVMKLRAPFP
ncbi:hypothetical protein OPV22_031548 [Ensete ventricosum]|uniref:DUF1264 domain-containing protein n=1 Tax=Ensete ventricosum TaxID=4639 RepID=A0AAV8PTW7_ENSVE|nr:hypothetical protein OPV22_031548 [Ensete ventricosum]